MVTKFRNNPVVFIGKIGTIVRDVLSSVLNHSMVENISEHRFHCVFILFDLDELDGSYTRVHLCESP